MKSFTDNAGRVWDVQVTVATCKRVQARLGINLPGLVADGAKGFADLLGDPCKLVDVVYILCSEQADKRGVTDEQFGQAMWGEPIEKAALAFAEAFTDFFPPRQRALLAAVLTKGREVGAKLLDLAEGDLSQALANLDPERTARQLLKRSNGSPGNAPAPSASTPGPLPSGNSS